MPFFMFAALEAGFIYLILGLVLLPRKYHHCCSRVTIQIILSRTISKTLSRNWFNLEKSLTTLKPGIG